MNIQSNLKKLLKHLVFEVPSILIAVLLALGLTTWKENRSQQLLTEVNVQHIFTDISRISGFSHTIILNEKAITRLQHKIDSASLESEDDIWGGFGILELNMNSWESFKSNNTYRLHVSFEMYNDIKFVMDEYGLYDRVVVRYRDFMINHDPEMSLLTKAKYILRYQKEILFRGKELLRKKEELMEKYPAYQ